MNPRFEEIIKLAIAKNYPKSSQDTQLELFKLQTANPVIEDAMKQAYNIALEDAVDCARLETDTCTGYQEGCCVPATRLNKQSILTLKINSNG